MAIGRASGVSARNRRPLHEVAASYGVMRDGNHRAKRCSRNSFNATIPVRFRRGRRLQQHAWQGGRSSLGRWLQEERLQLTRVHELLIRKGVTVSYTSLRRYVREAGLWKPLKTTLRMADWPPGRSRRWTSASSSIMMSRLASARPSGRCSSVLPYSRHCFARPLVQQTLAESIAGLEAAWRFFSGCLPQRLILDTPPRLLPGPAPLAPRPTRGFLEYSQERNFLCDPARVRKPRDKPHVERGIQYLRERFFKGGSFRDLEDCREQAERWCSEVAGWCVHGTTFAPVAARVAGRRNGEAAALRRRHLRRALAWKEVTVHPDHHVSFGQGVIGTGLTTSCPPGTKLEAPRRPWTREAYRRANW
ncbi:MAG: hypothetical protein R3B97_12805 [Dehalococcoidia bacterium]